MKIWFDMDGTIVDLYGVEGWLDMLHNEDVTPYAEAKPLVSFARLAKALHKAQRNGIEVGVISWTARNGSEDYNNRVRETKIEYLRKHLPSVTFDYINIVEYGYCKANFCGSEDEILFDDEEKNRKDWTGKAFTEKQIFEIIASLTL